MNQLRFVCAITVVAVLSGGLLRAESPWQSLARKISPGAIQSRLVPAGELPAVLDEGSTQSLTTSGAVVKVNGSPSDNTLPAIIFDSKSGKSVLEAMEQKASDVGLESDDNPADMARNLFENPEILRLLGDNPRFIYNPAGKQDPMLVPWVRDKVVYEELSTIAEGLLANNQPDEAKAVYKRIIAMNNPLYSYAAQARLAQIMTVDEAAVAAQSGGPQIPDEQLQLPEWINSNTSGVIISPGRNLCLVGDYMLNIGDRLPNYPEVTVAEITNDTVVYIIRNKRFDVHLNTALSDAEAAGW